MRFRRLHRGLPAFRPRHVSFGVKEPTGTWAFSIDGRNPVELGPRAGFEDMEDSFLVLRLINTLCLTDRQLDKGIVFDIGVRPHLGYRVARNEFRGIRGGLVSSSNEAMALLGEALAVERGDQDSPFTQPPRPSSA